MQSLMHGRPPASQLAKRGLIRQYWMVLQHALPLWNLAVRPPPSFGMVKPADVICKAHIWGKPKIPQVCLVISMAQPFNLQVVLPLPVAHSASSCCRT